MKIGSDFGHNKRVMALYACVDKGNNSATGIWQPLLQQHPPKSLGENMTSDLKSVTPITYLSMCILLIWYLAASEATTASK